MKIAMFIEQFYPIQAGAENAALRLSQELIRRGHEITVITKQFPGMASAETIDGITIQRIKAGAKGKLGTIFFTLKSLLRLRKMEYDILHMHGVGIFSGILAKAVTKPSIIKTTTAGDIVAIKKFGRFWLKTLPWIDYFACNTQEQYDEVKQELHVNQQIIPNGIDSTYGPAEDKDAIRKQLGFPQGEVFVYVGRLVHRKGVQFLVEFWKDFIKKRPDAYLIMLGSGKGMPDDCEAEVRAFIKEHNLEQHIFLKEEVKNVLDYLQGADFFIFPSEREGMSNAILEAMAVGVPIIASGIGGNIDLIRDGETGLVFTPKNKEDLERVILRVIGNKELKEKLGEGARNLVQQQFSVAVVADTYEEVYRVLKK